MQTSMQFKNQLNYMPMSESSCQFNHQECQILASLCYDGSHPRHIASGTTQLHYCTLDSSSTTSAYNASHNSPSTISASPISGSPLSLQDYQSDNIYGSSISASCSTEDPNDLQHMLREMENAVLGPELDNPVDSIQSAFESHLSLDPENWIQTMGIAQGDLKHALLVCAQAVAGNHNLLAERLIAQVRPMVSVFGDPIQRLGAYMLEGLVARLASSGSSIYKAWRCKEPASADLLSYMHRLYETCPYFKFGYLSANGAIAEAFKGEDRVHIIDFQIAQGTQWKTLIEALAKRPGGPPHFRITGIDDSVNAYARGGGLQIVGERLSQFARSYGVTLEFHPAVISGSIVQPADLWVQPGEALAVNFAFQLHHLPDESVDPMNHRDRVLRMVKSLSPKVVTLVEQESNTNTAPFLARFSEALNYYTAIFESIDVTLSREDRERINVEQHCLAREIVNIIACEGSERVERHELMGKWKSRFEMAGFTQVPLSPLVNATIKTLLEKYPENFRVGESDGTLYLGWMNRVLVASCAWR